MDDEDIKALTEHLRSVDCDDEEIAQILERVRQMDHELVHQSVFDSIASGSFNIASIIAEIRVKDENEGNSNALGT